MAVARAVAARGVERGIVIGDSGVEIAAAVDGIEGARSCAVVDCNHPKPELSRPANVLALGCRDLSIEQVTTWIDSWLAMSLGHGEQAT